jgi:LysM repeat protein
MAKLPKVTIALIVLTLVIMLSGCELRREAGTVSDPGPVSDLPPTLAPLGAETEVLVEATAVPTVSAHAIASVNPPTTQKPAVEIADNTVAPGASAATVALDGSANNVAGEAASTGNTAVSPAETAPNTGLEADQSIVVDAADNLPIGGPVAANPPAGQDAGGYNAPAYNNGGVELNYQVLPGDTLYSIAQRFGSSVDSIVYANALTSEDVIGVGQVLRIPGANPNAAAAPVQGYNAQPNTGQQPYQQQQPYNQQPQQPQQQPYAQQPQAPQPYIPGPGDAYHMVAPGDTLFSIAMRYSSTVDTVAQVNGLEYPYLLSVGQQLVIPYARSNNNGYGVPQQGYQQPVDPNSYYQQPQQGYQQPVDPNGYYQQPVDPNSYYQQPQQGYQQPIDPNGYYPQQGYQQPVDPNSYYQQPQQGYQQPVDPNSYYQQPQQGYQQPVDPNGYYQQPQQGGYYQQPQSGGYYQQPAGPSAGTHAVAPGETLYSIAARYGLPAETLAASNGLANPNQIYVGQVLFLP